MESKTVSLFLYGPNWNIPTKQHVVSFVGNFTLIYWSFFKKLSRFRKQNRKVWENLKLKRINPASSGSI